MINALRIASLGRDFDDNREHHLLNEGSKFLAGDNAIAVRVKELESLRKRLPSPLHPPTTIKKMENINIEELLTFGGDFDFWWRF